MEIRLLKDQSSPMVDLKKQIFKTNVCQMHLTTKLIFPLSIYY